MYLTYSDAMDKMIAMLESADLDYELAVINEDANAAKSATNRQLKWYEKIAKFIKELIARIKDWVSHVGSNYKVTVPEGTPEISFKPDQMQKFYNAAVKALSTVKDFYDTTSKVNDNKLPEGDLNDLFNICDSAIHKKTKEKITASSTNAVKAGHVFDVIKRCEKLLQLVDSTTLKYGTRDDIGTNIKTSGDPGKKITNKVENFSKIMGLVKNIAQVLNVITTGCRKILTANESNKKHGKAMKKAQERLDQNKGKTALGRASMTNGATVVAESAIDLLSECAEIIKSEQRRGVEFSSMNERRLSRIFNEAALLEEEGAEYIDDVSGGEGEYDPEASLEEILPDSSDADEFVEIMTDDEGSAMSESVIIDFYA